MPLCEHYLVSITRPQTAESKQSKMAETQNLLSLALMSVTLFLSGASALKSYFSRSSDFRTSRSALVILELIQTVRSCPKSRRIVRMWSPQFTSSKGSCLILEPTVSPGTLSARPSPGFGPSFGERPMPTRSSAPNCTSVW